MIFLGYDPGGKRANGAAYARFSNGKALDINTATFSYVEETIEWFMEQVGKDTPKAIGIDAYLTWSSLKSGWRNVDEYLRNKHQKVAKSVFSSNSAHGSMAIQGMAMAFRVRNKWPIITLNETHPKVLYFAMRNKKYSFSKTKMSMSKWLLSKIIYANDYDIRNEHEWDALFSAWATYQGMEKKFSRDLDKELGGNLIHPVENVSYFWPTDKEAKHEQ